MIFDLPYSLEVDGIERPINCDYRDVLTIITACNDDLDPQEIAFIILNNLYVDDFNTFSNIEEAYKKACWFLDWGKEYKEEPQNAPKLVDWEKDYNCIISAVNKVTKTEVRSLDFLHWWTFLGYFSERGECQYSFITEIRDKLNKGKKLEPHEKEFLRNNRDEVIIKSKFDEQFLNELFGDDINA